MKKKKILMISDHALTTSGVATQSRHLIEGLLKTNQYQVIQLGAAVRHENYNIVKLSDDFLIKPIDGFGNKEMIRGLLISEKPDAILIFTDPRFFTYLFEMEDEIHQVCPILYWHVWDNRPTPHFNKKYYDAVDTINCLSYLTYEMCKEIVPDKTYYIPHAIPQSIFYPLNEDEIAKNRQKLLGDEKKDWFVSLWANRNCRRKRPGDLIYSWKNFIDRLEKEEGHRKALLICHTEPFDHEGQDLMYIARQLGIEDNIIYSRNKIGFNEMNILHNIVDCYINISYAEGFGLGTLEAMQCGKPIIALTTGGQTRQIIDWRDNSLNGIMLPVEFATYSGNQNAKQILEDFVSVETIGKSLFDMYLLGVEGRKKLGQKARAYALFEFNYDDMIRNWANSINETISNWKSKRENFEIVNLLGERI